MERYDVTMLYVDLCTFHFTIWGIEISLKNICLTLSYCCKKFLEKDYSHVCLLVDVVTWFDFTADGISATTHNAQVVRRTLAFGHSFYGNYSACRKPRSVPTILDSANSKLMASGLKVAPSMGRPSCHEGDSRTEAVRESPRAAATWVNQGSPNGPREISSRVRFAVRCLRIDSRTPTYRCHHVAVWMGPAESRADSGIEYAVTVDISRSAGSIDLDLSPDSENDDATWPAVVQAAGKRRLEQQDYSVRSYASDCSSWDNVPEHRRSELDAEWEDKSLRCCWWGCPGQLRFDPLNQRYLSAHCSRDSW